MIPSSYKASSALIKEVFKSGKRMSSPHFLVRFILKNGLKKGLFSVIVPTSLSRKPTERNVLKRRVYNALSPHVSKIKEGYCFVFILKREIHELSFLELEKELEKTLHAFF